MRGLTSNLRHLIIIVVFLFSLFMIQSIVLAKSKGIIATIKNNKGAIDTVNYLKARYVAEGNWMRGDAPTRIAEAIVFVYYEKEGLTTFKNEIVFPFFEMASLKYIPFPKNKFEKQYIIEKKDGLTIIIDNERYVEKDKNDNLIKSINIDGYIRKIGEAQGQNMTLRGLKGEVERDGRKGDYYIPISQVSEIIFK